MAKEENKRKSKKKRRDKKIKVKLINIARELIIGYIVLVTLFSFDTTTVLGFFIHSLPSIIFLVTLIIFWKKPKTAGVLFALEGLGTIFVFNTYKDLFVLSIISFVPIIVGLLFFLSKNPKH
jgi:uncharacterized membrane protein